MKTASPALAAALVALLGDLQPVDRLVRLYSTKTLAQALDVGRSTVDGWLASGQLAYTHAFGRSRRIGLGAVIDFLSQHEIATGGAR